MRGEIDFPCGGIFLRYGERGFLIWRARRGFERGLGENKSSKKSKKNV